jgi:hypothetical protein
MPRSTTWRSWWWRGTGWPSRRPGIGTELEQVSGRIAALVGGLQNGVFRARMAPVDEVFDRFPRMVRDLGRELGKEIRLEVQGAEIELDRSVLDALTEPLTHLLRNAADHGLETPAERVAVGKTREGTVRLRAERARDEVTVVVADDGRGIDRNGIRQRAEERGLLDPRAPVPDAAGLLRLLSHPGFTTKSEVTAVSGRGVGIDAVLARIRSLGGRMELKTQPGRGTTFLLHLPVTRPSRALLGGWANAMPFPRSWRKPRSRAAGPRLLTGESSRRPICARWSDSRACADRRPTPPAVVIDSAARVPLVDAARATGRRGSRWSARGFPAASGATILPMARADSDPAVL